MVRPAQLWKPIGCRVGNELQHTTLNQPTTTPQKVLLQGWFSRHLAVANKSRAPSESIFAVWPPMDMLENILLQSSPSSPGTAPSPTPITTVFQTSKALRRYAAHQSCTLCPSSPSTRRFSRQINIQLPLALPASPVSNTCKPLSLWSNILADVKSKFEGTTCFLDTCR
jgi:hypothetical protein